MSIIQDGEMKGFFCEKNKQWPGQAMSLEIEEVLWDQKSDFQHVIVFKSKSFGNVLILDGVIQFTEKDEMAYQEMISHLPMFAHENPERVLVVGGGDGGCIREILKHKSVTEVVICEIDKMVIECGKKFFPTVRSAWEDSRVTLVCDDAAKYMAQDECKGKFDVIVSDTSDPVGPAEPLFEPPFYKCMFEALRPGGRIATQAESIWNNLDLIKRLVQFNFNIWANVEYASTQIPTYPCGQIGILCCSKAGDSKKRKASKPTSAKPSRAVPDDMELRFYTSALHEAAFVLPAFVEKAIEEATPAPVPVAKAEKKASAKKRKK